MDLVLLRLSALGDILRVLPAWANLREAFPEARFRAVVEDRHAFLLEPLPVAGAGDRAAEAGSPTR